MNEELKALQSRVEGFKLDESGARFPFSSKLAKENGWTTAFTNKAIEEYKRFTFLAVAAGHPVSPSDAVDQVWHMHLTYSDNYWNVFCKEILRKPFHHHPSKGGQDESDKFEDWYARTLASYEKFFGPPPADIWPAPGSQAAMNHDFVRVDCTKVWILPKPVLRKPWQSVGLAAVALAAIGCTQVVATVNPFDFRSPEFLAFYAALATGVIVLGAVLRNSFRKPVDGPKTGDLDLDVYDIAYLNGGEVLAANTAIAGLVRKGLAEVDSKTTNFRAQGVDENEDDRVQSLIGKAALRPEGRKVAEVRPVAAAALESVRAKLRKSGLLVDQFQGTKAMVVPLAVAMIAPIMGVVKIVIGIQRERPVAFLAIMVVISVLVSLVVFLRRPFRSKYGDKVLDDLRSKNRSYANLKKAGAELPYDAMTMGVALFGMSALSGTQYNSLQKDLQPKTGSTSCGGGSSDSGGGGGDGGGCGGGGCGGCGS